MNFTRQEIKKRDVPRYLLLLEASSCHDMDEWMGIYFDDEKLKKAYDELFAELEEKRKVDRSYRSLKVAIWEFRPRQEYEDDPPNSQESINAKQDISPVKIEELRCFKERFG